ncbi:MAG: 3-hydroxyacyl-ACP dehydratase FabZ [Rhizomicrobium sp.]
MADPSIGVAEIKKLLPHRPPMLLVERLTDIVKLESATGWKAIGINEPFFVGHFPDYAVMPGVLIVEAMAQTAGAVVMHSLGLERERDIVYFMAIEKARFRKPVHPGDMLRMPVKALRRRGPVWRFGGQAFVGDVLCAQAEFSATIHSGVTAGDDPRDSAD